MIGVLLPVVRLIRRSVLLQLQDHPVQTLYVGLDDAGQLFDLGRPLLLVEQTALLGELGQLLQLGTCLAEVMADHLALSIELDAVLQGRRRGLLSLNNPSDYLKQFLMRLLSVRHAIGARLLPHLRTLRHRAKFLCALSARHLVQ